MPIKRIVRKIAKKLGGGKAAKKPPKKAAPKRNAPKAVKKPAAAKSPVSIVEARAPEPKKPAVGKRRFTKKELEHYREKLLSERERILRELGRITEAINESAEEQEASKQSYSNHLADIGTDYMEKEKNYYYADQEGQYLKAIEAALKRIETGEYGLCRECSGPISEKRLEAVPAAELCIACMDKKEKLERGR